VDARAIPGAIVIIARNGKVLADVTVGWLDVEKRVPLPRDAIFRLYSMSKPITSVAIMMLVERGKLRLDDPAEKYLPEFSNMRVYVSGGVDDMVTEPVRRPITIADLLTHSSGITYHFTGNTPVHQFYRKYGVMRDTPVGRMPTDGTPAHSLDELVARIGKAPLLLQPGTQFAYSYSTTMLGAIIERVSGQRLDRFLEAHLFRPLGMKHSGFFIDDSQLPKFTVLYQSGKDGITVNEQPAKSDYRDRNRLLDGGGAIAATADDYLRFAEMLANGGTLHGRRILSEASVDAMFTPRVKMAGLGPQAMMFGYGFSIGDEASAASGMQPAGTASWSGSGNTYFFVDRRRKAVALLMTHVLGSAGAARVDVNRAAMQLIGN
jgi:CubicO group peptidase (beta-lactamase class C family)